MTVLNVAIWKTVNMSRSKSRKNVVYTISVYTQYFFTFLTYQWLRDLNVKHEHLPSVKCYYSVSQPVGNINIVNETNDIQHKQLF